MSSADVVAAIADIEALVPVHVIALIPKALQFVGEAIVIVEAWHKETTAEQQAAVLTKLTEQITATTTLTASEKAVMIQLCTVLLPEVWSFGGKAVVAIEQEAVTVWGKITSCFKGKSA